MAKLGDYVPTPADVEYIEAAHGILPAAVAELEARGRRDGIPIVDRAAGRVLAVLATGRRAILEIGTAYGYSTLWMALAMPADGRIVTIDPDRARTDVARGYWRAAGVPDERIVVVNRPALEALGDGTRAADPELAGPFDLVFIDAVKDEYVEYLEAALPRCRTGAIVVADNVLWSGHVSGTPPATSSPRSESSTEALRAFNRHALAHPRLAATILPVGDGLLFGVVGD
jgi:predicted O-methyltransferase YrrM